MTEIDALKYELEESRNAFDTLHKKYVELLKQQGRLEKENEQLKEALKNSYINEICENCKYGDYYFVNTPWAYEGDFECKKGHNGEDCDGLEECSDFELDLKRFK